MIENLIAIGAIGVVINLIMFFVLRVLSRRFSQHMKNYLYDSMSYYSDLLKEKEQRLEELNAKLELAAPSQEKAVEGLIEQNPHFSDRHVEYRSEQFFNTYKLIKENFRRDYRSLIQEFIDMNITGREGEGKHTFYEALLKKMNQEVCYDLMTTVEEELDEKLKILFTEWEYTEIEKYREREGFFDVCEFCDWLSDKVNQEASKAVIKVSRDLCDLETKAPHYEICCDESLIEGVKILYKGRVIDYSLSQ